MLEEIAKKLDGGISGERMKELAGAIAARDRWCSFSIFRETARMCRDRMKEVGLKSARVFSFPADGKTSAGDYVIPRAWDPEDAELRVMTPEGDCRTLASYKEIPCCLFLYSASTPAKGVEAEVVAMRGDREEDYRGRSVRGKVIFTPLYPAPMWKLAAKHGAIGIITDTSAVRPVHEGVQWVNYAFFPDNKAGQFGFSLSKEKGEYLRELIARAKKKGQCVKVHARVKVKSYAGTIDTVSGVLPGRNPGEEVIAFAHLAEVGAWDNASGSAAVIEIARVLGELIAKGKLRPPARNIRFMLGWECYSLMVYLLQEKRKATNAIAGLSLDAFGVDPLEYDAPLRVYRTPDANPSYVDIVLEEIAERYLADKGNVQLWQTGDFFGGDGLPSDPCFDTPMIYLYQPCKRIWHTSADTVDRLSPDVLKWAGVIGGTYLYYLADAGDEEAMRLADVIALRQPRLLREIAANAPGKSAASPAEEIAYVQDREVARLRSTERIVPKGRRKAFRKRLASLEERIESSVEGTSLGERAGSSAASRELTALEKKAASMVPRRLVPGILTLETLPEEAKKKCRWGPDYHVLVEPILWTDGTRNLLEISRKVRLETGEEQDLGDFIECFKFLEKHGYVEVGE